MKWIKIIGQEAVPGAIQVNATLGPHYVGRINTTLKNGTPYTQIGKIYKNIFYYMGGDNLKKVLQGTVKDDIEILVCQE